MFAWSLADGRLFVDTVQDLVLRLDRVEPGEPVRLLPALPALRKMVLDVCAYAYRAGQDGVRFCELAVRVVDDLEVVVRDHDAGDRSAWAGRRLQLLLIWAELEDFVVQAAPLPAVSGVGLVEASSGAAAAVSAGEKVKKVKKVSGLGRGRQPKLVGASREDEAAWWRDQCHRLPAIGDSGDELKLPEMFDAMLEHEFEVSLQELGAGDAPLWWPVGPDGVRKTVCRFGDNWRNMRRDTWAKYVQRADNRLLRPIEPRHSARNTEVANPTGGVGGRARLSRDQVLLAFEDAIDLASGLWGCREEKRLRKEAKLFGILKNKLGMDRVQIDGLVAMDEVELVKELSRQHGEAERFKSRN